MTIQILTDLQAAFENYPHEYLTIDIVDVAFSGSAINVDEIVEFNVQIANTGPLDVNDVELLFEGLNGTEVRTGSSLANWASSFSLDAGFFPKVPAHSGDAPVQNTASPFQFRAKKKSTKVTDLVRVSISGWNTDLTHLEVAHTRADTAAAGVFGHAVAAS